jgi:polysaccharide pyruvyl transferase WcaK-like protein
MKIEEDNIKIGLLGALLDTGNMGVSALAESCVKCILHRCPDAEIVFVGGGRHWDVDTLTVSGRTLQITKIPIRFCSNIFIGSHFLILFVLSMLHRLFPFGWMCNTLKKINRAHRHLASIDMFCDITGGDSFSDIYGMKRFVLSFCCKWLAIVTGKPFIMLPQTYGPFKRTITQKMARFILKKADIIWSRDKEGVSEISKLLGQTDVDKKVRISPDIAFILDPRQPQDSGLLEMVRRKAPEGELIGINVSGLLYHGGFTGDNMFELKFKYSEFILRVVKYFVLEEGVSILLVPHVFPPKGLEVESDLLAIGQVYEKVKDLFSRQVYVVDKYFDHAEMKYVISLCDFFIGSRMHSCIAAMSQCIPAIGLAYSKKFKGVFETIGMGQWVADMRQLTKDEIIEVISRAYSDREAIAEQLRGVMPGIEEKVLGVFEGIAC